MFGYDKISLIFSYHWIVLLIFIGLSLIFSVYSYRFTLPPIPPFKKIILISLRFLALILLISVFFEPVLLLQEKLTLRPTHIIFIDDSKSISVIKDKNKLNELTNKLLNLKNYDIRVFKFGTDVKEITSNDDAKINFAQRATNFSQIFRLQEILKNDYQNLNPASITILSDGIITDGINPIYQAEKLGLPVFVFAVGDSSRKKDILIKNVIYNETVYLGKQTTISATVSNYGYSNKAVNISLIENNQVLDNQIISLNTYGLNTVNFNYTPKEKGERKLQIKIEQLTDEDNKNNNVYPFFLNVSEDKIKILLLAGAPNPDLTFIKRILESEDAYQVNSLTQINQDIFLEDNYKTILDSADILFLIGFPNKSTSERVFNDIKNKITIRKTPFFLLLNNDIDLNKIRQIESELPIKLETNIDNYIKIQPDINLKLSGRNDLIKNISESDWNKLPPILYPPNLASPKTESSIISYVRAETNRLNFPLIIQRSIASSRNITFIGKDFWRWKLQTAVNNLSLYDNLILNTAKWLSVTDGNRQFKVKTLKKFYSANDNVDFVGELYDELLNPIDDGEIEVTIKSEKDEKTLQLISLGNGLYEGNLLINKAGDYSFIARANLKNKTVLTASGKFNVGDVDLEMMDLRMNYEFLSELSKRTNGEMFSTDEFSSYLNKLEKLNKRTSSVRTVESQIKLWSSEIILIIVIILFSIEWFIRKQSSLL